MKFLLLILVVLVGIEVVVVIMYLLNFHMYILIQCIALKCSMTTSIVHKAQSSSRHPNEDWLVVLSPPLPKTQARMIHFHVLFYVLQMP